MIEMTVCDIIEGRRKGRGLKPILHGASRLFSSGVALRNMAYAKQWFKPLKLPVPVISIGNISVGGTGKTPLVRMLAQEFDKIAILSRGYRSKMERQSGLVPKNPDARIWGDEPSWLALRLPKAQVWVGRNRCYTGQKAIENGAKILLLDDGMQFRALERDVEIVVLDVRDPWGKGYFLPRGYLRDAPERLASAHLIVINGVEDLDQYAQVKNEIARYSSAPIVGMCMRWTNSGEFAGKKAGVFCGIGRPERFLSRLEAVDRLIAPDHAGFTKEKLEMFAQECKGLGAEILLCTEKDEMKLPQSLQSCLPIISVKAELQIVDGSDEWQQMINKIRTSL